MINMAAATSAVLEALGDDSGQFIGDGVKPELAGWLNGEPNSGVFAPYSVLAFAGGVQRDDTWRYAEAIRAWNLSWRLSHYGASRAQCDFVATRVREAVAALMGSTIAGYRVNGGRWPGLGAMSRDDSINPPLWSVSDTLILMVDA